MKITTSELTQDRQWRALLGISKKQFFTLFTHFKKTYIEIYEAELAARKVENNVKYCIKDEEELLLFTLFSLKSGLTYDALGVVCGMNGSNAKRNQGIGLKVLAQTLTNLNVMPERKLLTVEDFQACLRGEKELILMLLNNVYNVLAMLNNSKKPTQVKKAHTLKSMLIVTKNKVIRYLSHPYGGRRHDFHLLKQDFPPELP